MSEPERAAPGLAAHGVSERAVLDALPRAVVVTAPDGTILLWNHAAEQLYGWPEHDVLGRSVLDVLAPDDELTDNRDRLTHVAAGNATAGDRFVVDRSGRRLRIATHTRPLFDADGHTVAIVGAAEDVTELRASEQRARQLNDHFRLALQAGGLGTWRWDIAAGTTTWDERLEQLFGLEPGGFDGTYDDFMALVHPDDRDALEQAVQAAIEQRGAYRVEHRVVWPDGSIRWIAGAGATVLDEDGAVVGTVGCAMDVTDRTVQEHERQRLAAMALQVADLERLQRERLEFLSAINDALNRSTTVQEIMANVTAQAVPRLGDWCTIHVLPTKDATIPDVEIAHVDPEMVEYAKQLQQRFPYDPDAPSGVAHVIRTGETEFHREITDDVIERLDAPEEARDVIARLALRSAITVPLRKRNRIIGAMQFVMSSSSRGYVDDDVALAQNVAGRIAASIENRRLDQQQREIAQTLQRSLLPASLPDIDGVEVAVRYWPAGEAAVVGGDFYDVFELDADRRWAVVVGDVCGTGPNAAALTGLARHSIRDSAWHGDTATSVLESLNRAVLRSSSNSFLTAVYAVLDRSGTRTTLGVTAGGHPLPVHAGGHGVTTIGEPGTLLGVLDDAHFRPRTVDLAPGDVVVFYTDGATDLRPPYALDVEQFSALVGRSATGGTADEVADRIHGELERVLAFDRRNDDIALLVLRVAGPPRERTGPQ